MQLFDVLIITIKWHEMFPTGHKNQKEKVNILALIIRCFCKWLFFLIFKNKIQLLSLAIVLFIAGFCLGFEVNNVIVTRWNQRQASSGETEFCEVDVSFSNRKESLSTILLHLTSNKLSWFYIFEMVTYNRPFNCLMYVLKRTRLQKEKKK